MKQGAFSVWSAASLGLAVCSGAAAQPAAEPGAAAPPEPQAGAPEAAGEATKAAREWFGHQPWWEWSRATGDWGGGRAWLEERGLDIGANYTLDWQSVWEGGLNNVASTRHLFDVWAELDLETAAGIDGATIYADAYATSVRGGSRDVGDWQWVSSIETGENRSQLAELWWEQRLLDDRLGLKLGKIDANVDFAYLDSTTGFLNASAETPATAAWLPTYPDPAMGVVALFEPTERVYVHGGFFDGATADGYPTGDQGPSTFFSDDKSSSWFWIAEAGGRWESLGGSTGAGTAGVGVHYSTADTESFAGDPEEGVLGVYAQAEQLVWQGGTGDDAPGVTAILRLGWADPEVWDVQYHAAAGAVWSGLIPSRPDDALRAFVTFVDLSDEPGAGFIENETTLELNYSIQVTGFLTVTPDLQFVINPSGDPSIDDALVGGVRVELEF